MRYIHIYIIASLAALFLLLSCSESDESKVSDKCNELSYKWRYASLDSSLHYAMTALKTATNGAQKAEACNSMAFVNIQRMKYDRADELLDSVDILTDNQVELLIADIQRMRLCQRQSKNKDFYSYRGRAIERQRRIDEERNILSEHQLQRLNYAESEFAIVSSTYYYYVGLEKQSREALADIDRRLNIERDTLQWLNYMYNIGSGGIAEGKTAEEVTQTEFDYLMRCYLMAEQKRCKFWIANSLQALSEHLQDDETRHRLLKDNLPALKFLNRENMPDSLLAGYLAQQALDLFKDYGDVYQVAGAYRTLAQCYWHIGDNASSLICLNKALEENTAIQQAPDLVASIHEQLSVVYASLNDKPNSDYNRNVYLDMQERTRQDRYLESRVEQLDTSVTQLNIMIAAVMLMIVAVLVMLFIFYRMRRKRDNNDRTIEQLLQPLQLWNEKSRQQHLKTEERKEEIAEANIVADSKRLANKKRDVEQRAKMSLAESVLPLIERMLHEIHRLQAENDENADTPSCLDDGKSRERQRYIAELTDKIIEYNNLLTEWIQLDKGELNVQIESFRLQSLFDIVERSRMSFSINNIELDIVPSNETIKADKMLTLFMLNTLADNARKFTPAGGKVTISSTSTDKYVEVSIADTGRGMTDDELADAFSLEHKIENGHGFGLLNCRGIIEKYKKLSSLFAVAAIGAESQKGRGSRFYFRLPKGIVRTVLAMLVGFSSVCADAKDNHAPQVRQSGAFADSIYYCNIRGEYERALQFADSARMLINREYRQLCNGHAADTMVSIGNASVGIPEIKWWHDKMKLDYDVILDVRNESAVAALALHKWDLYNYNNKVYTSLYKETSADKNIDNYVRIMQQSETNRNVAIVILVLLLLSIFPAYYLLYYQHLVYNRFCVDQVKSINKILLSADTDENKLRQIDKIPTDRFPSVLLKIVDDIKSALSVSIENDKTFAADLEIATDNLRKTELEVGALHVSNNVLSNSLSTLKHETMYYPAHIHNLMESSDADISVVGEIATYYHTLYSLLCRQAVSLNSKIDRRSKRFPIKTLAENAGVDFVYDNIAPDHCLLGDREMMIYCLEILLRMSGEKRLKAYVSPYRSQYVEIKIPFRNLCMTDEEVAEMFVPVSKNNIPYLICRQIIRDMGAYTHARECGIMASRDSEGRVVVTMILASEQTKDKNI